jgi:hypothetical protein
MATEILRPNGAGDEADSVASGAATRHECVDEAVADDDTTYITDQGTAAQFTSLALDSTALTTETVNSVDAHGRARELTGGGSTWGVGVRLSGSNSMGSEFDLTNSYVSHEAAALARPGGGSWAVADLNSLQVRVRQSEGGASNECRTTQMYVEVNYTGVAAAITGTAGDGTTEVLIVAGGQTIIITLTGDTWVASGATFNAQRQNIIDGIAGSGGDTTDQLQDGLAVTDVVRTDNNTVTITASAIPGYNIASTATYQLTVPGTAVTGGSPIVATPTFVVTAGRAMPPFPNRTLRIWHHR